MTDLNLLPWRAALLERRTRWFLIAAAMAAVLVLACVLAARFQAHGELARRQAAVSALQQELAMLETQLDERRRGQRQDAALTRQLRRFDAMHNARIGLVHRLDALARLLPDNAWFTAVSRQGDSLEISGMAQDEGSAAALMRGIEASPWFAGPVALHLQQPQQVSGQRSQGAGPVSPYRFQLSVQLAGAEELP
ncbi:MAG TPA: PilN domain-containing protein [Hyphomicrobiales bacterium]|nr:PilN domain-containing protein [Hyphomicrobiales bacterium]